jgi:hypothetical protein
VTKFKGMSACTSLYVVSLCAERSLCDGNAMATRTEIPNRSRTLPRSQQPIHAAPPQGTHTLYVAPYLLQSIPW